jgi:hypothetical protein
MADRLDSRDGGGAKVRMQLSVDEVFGSGRTLLRPSDFDILAVCSFLLFFFAFFFSDMTQFFFYFSFDSASAKGRSGKCSGCGNATLAACTP